jgi:hypothetical protein
METKPLQMTSYFSFVIMKFVSNYHTPFNGVLLNKAMLSQLVKKRLAFYGSWGLTVVTCLCPEPD